MKSLLKFRSKPLQLAFIIGISTLLSFNVNSFELASVASAKVMNPIEIPQKDKIDLIVTVNHGENLVHIELKKSIKGVGTLNITNLDDKIIYTAEVRLWDGSSVIDIDQSNFEKGTYEITLSTKEGVFQSKFTLS